ncbi:MAG: S-adenosylmethionine tRNA ribosyltransferase [Flavipsychrobacter sp.]|nr:S-adenosylmethionine tRNA ribosyltransferase [Flavipsychrobacter sp.]
MHPKELRIEDFIYPLPDERIAKHPLQERDASKLLIYKEGTITENIYTNIADNIPADSLMVFNQTKVVNARLLFKKPSGSTIEVFCLAPNGQYADIQTAMLQKGKVLWECLVGGAAKWKPGMVLEIVHSEPSFTLSAQIVERSPTAFTLSLEWDDAALTFAEVLHYTGKVPLPPYMHRDAAIEDEDRYQTVFAKEEGSVAAPTAGLHFTDDVIQRIAANNIDTAFLTLHVGAGTFRTVKSETMAEHDMHAEWIEVTLENINILTAALSKNIIAVGTTSLRTLESLYWIGNKIVNGETPDLQNIAVSQWDPYDTQNTCSTTDAFNALAAYMVSNKLSKLITRTQILIAPGYTFRVVNCLVTNFHQPQSTLLLLVAAFIGDDWRTVYDYALGHDYRFLSYGDGSVLFRNS